MTIRDEDDINAAVVIALRHASGLGPSAFWRAISVTPQAGRNYENGRAMPAPVRRLVMLEYVAGLNTSMGLERARALAAIEAGTHDMTGATGDIDQAVIKIRNALRQIA